MITKVLSKHGFTIPSPVRCKPTSPERLGREGEAKGKLTPCVVAAREWRVNSLADLKHTPDPCIASISHHPMEYLQKEISSNY